MAVITITVLKQGSRGPEVFDLQHLLLARAGADLDELGAVDGIFGPLTEIAVLNFQAHQPVEADGIVNPDTWRALAAEWEWPDRQPGRFLRQGDRGKSVRQLQQGLQRQRLYHGAIDGLFGPRTREAVILLQRTGKPVSNVNGVVGPLTFRASVEATTRQN